MREIFFFLVLGLGQMRSREIVRSVMKQTLVFSVFFLESLLKVNIPYSENNALQYQIRIFNECVVYTCDRK